MKKDKGCTVIAGCGRLGASIAGKLSEERKDVVILDNDKCSFRKLPFSYGGLSIVGNATDMEKLNAALIDAKAFIAVTDLDCVNISLSTSLIKKGYRVTGVNKNYDHCEKLAEIDKLRVIYGDGSKKFILEEAKAGDHQIAIALTPSDETNLVICEMCKKYFDVKKTVCLLNDP